MQIRPRLEAVIEDMLDGHILLDEALEEFEKLYIQKAFARNKKRISHTAEALGIHCLGGPSPLERGPADDLPAAA